MPSGRFIATALLATALAACGRISPDWTISDHTMRLEGPGAVGIAPAGGGLGPGHSPAAGRGCVPGSTSSSDAFAFRPGLGARLRIGFWTTSTYEGAVLPPLTVGIDLVLRKVEGRLPGAEKAALATFLATNRWRSEVDQTESRERSLAAANTVAAHEVELWNGLVETLCVSVTTEEKSDPPRRIWSVGADISHMCGLLPGEDARRDFARIFLESEEQCARPDGGDASGHVFANFVKASPSALRSPFQVAAGVATPELKPPFYHAMQMVRVGALGDIVMQRPHFLSPGTEGWSLLDWEASGICVDRRGQSEPPRISSVLFGLERYRIVGDAAAASHQVSRILGQGYSYGVRPRPGAAKTGGESTLARSDLAYLTPRDVSATFWRAKLGNRTVWSRPSCSRKG